MSIGKKFHARGKFSPMLIVVYALIFSTLGYIIVRSFAATPPNAPSIYVTPTAQTLAPNTTFTVAIRENSGTTAVNAVQANLSYPANLVDFVSIDATGSAFTTDAQATGAAGVINIARGIIGSVTGDKLVANVTFKTKTTTGAAAIAFTAGTSVVESTNFQDILGGLTSTGGGTFTVDATKPVVSISAPTEGASVALGPTANVVVNNTDNSSVSTLTIAIDGVNKAVLTNPGSPYTYPLITSGASGLTIGAHAIVATASDAYGNSSSVTRNIVIADLSAPTVSISSPLPNATVSGPTTVQVSAADNSGGSGINRVEFYVDGTIKGTPDTTAPYSFSWDTTTAIAGNHSLTAKAFDNAATPNSQTSTAVTVKVDNTDHTAPSAPGSFSAGTKTHTSVTLTWTASSDNIAVTGYRVQRNGTTVSTTAGNVLTFTDSSLTAGTTYNYTVAATDLAGNFSTTATLSAQTIPIVIGDLNDTGHVDIFDISILLSKWNSTTNPEYDINKNGASSGIIDIFDLSLMLSHWG